MKRTELKRQAELRTPRKRKCKGCGRKHAERLRKEAARLREGGGK